MARPKDRKYDDYAKHRIATRLMDVYKDYGHWQLVADAITAHIDIRDVEFARTDINRVRNRTAGDMILDRVVAWFETRDPNFRETLRPESIFAEVGTSTRDYYFHLYGMENLEEWDESLLTEFEGVYLCAPEHDANSYMPSPRVREILIDKKPLPENWRGDRSADIKQYISQRSFLILKRTDAFHYWAAEVPYGALFPPSFVTLDIRSFYEGVGIASSNTIHVFLRECMSRVPKLHSMIIRPKSEHRTYKFRGVDIYADSSIRHLETEFGMMVDDDVAHMKREFALDIHSDVFLRGTSQSNISPLAWTKNKVEIVFGREQVYHRKPSGFLEDTETHFVSPDLDIRPQLEQLIDNPLIVGEMLGDMR